MTKFGSLETLREDAVATCANREFKVIGLPSQFLLEDNKSESESCGLCGGKYLVLWTGDDKE